MLCRSNVEDFQNVPEGEAKASYQITHSVVLLNYRYLLNVQLLNRIFQILNQFSSRIHAKGIHPQPSVR